MSSPLATSGTTVSDLPPGVGDIQSFLRAALGDLEPEPARTGTRGRPRILTSACLWSAMLVCVLDGFSAQLAIWRQVAILGLWDYPRHAISDAAVYKRLEQGGSNALATLLMQITRRLDQRLEPWLPRLGPPLAAFASEVVALDETTLDPLARRFPATRGEPPTDRHLPGKLAVLFDVRRQLFRTVQIIADAAQNERVAARELLFGLAPGALVLFDRGYFSFRLFDDLSDRGLWWITRLRQRTSYQIIHTSCQYGEVFDGIVWLGVHRADRAKHPVRLIQFRLGNQLCQYVTNVRDPQWLPLDEVPRLYARRWDIEMAFALIKQQLGLSLWWSGKDTVIHQQLYAILIIAQILQALRLEVAARAEVDVFDVSLPLLVRSFPRFAACGEDPVAVFVERGRAAGFIRASRRIAVRAPDPPLAVAVSIASVPILRTPRYAERKCTRVSVD